MFDIFFLSKASAQKSIGEPKHRKLQNVFFFLAFTYTSRHKTFESKLSKHFLQL
jgi:hypothetical protein